MLPLCLQKSCPPKDTQTKIYRRRIKGIELSLQLKDTIDSLGLSKTHQMINKLFEDSVIAQLIRFGQVASGHKYISEPEILGLSLMRSTKHAHLSQTSITNQLSEHHYQQLIPTCKRTHVFVALILVYYSIEHPVRQQIHQLSKNIFSRHSQILKFDLCAAKNAPITPTEDFHCVTRYNIAC